MKKTYFAPQITAYGIQVSQILAESETIKVDDNKTTPGMLSKECVGFDDEE